MATNTQPPRTRGDEIIEQCFVTQFGVMVGILLALQVGDGTLAVESNPWIGPLIQEFFGGATHAYDEFLR